MLVGYARISTDHQTNKLQLDALNAAGCERIYSDQESGGVRDRPELNRMLDQLRKDDVVICWKIDRMSRSLRDLLDIMAKIENAGAGFRSLTEAVDTTSPAGRMMLHMLGAVAEFEKAMTRARTKAGLDAARKAGKLRGAAPDPAHPGRPGELVRQGAGREARRGLLVLSRTLDGAARSRLLAAEGCAGFGGAAR